MESIVQKQLHQQQHLYYSHALQSMGLHDMLHGESYAARHSPLSYDAPLNIPALPLPSRLDRVPEATHPHAYQLGEQDYTPRLFGVDASSLSTGTAMSAIDNRKSLCTSDSPDPQSRLLGTYAAVDVVIATYSDIVPGLGWGQ
ncbi:hypothetical protein EXIGLDRAFT_733240 [Exidia glandulosa HHB12029]|uniref:Uncharacterized protein n=1 Tax=Exidia glandulosa HHB12029 TaxID=1314781 RepID=A0A165BCN8_EXIGL|nr:hypothetical protein EXIGLDRAFT_733240 [Exidia glandulosa HHB12029]